MQYRRDIEGLRAIAVVAVLLFHFGVPGVDGGFVGVDLFFVLSGYLITTLLIGEHGGAITAGVLSSLLSALVTLYVTAMLTAIYRHLGGQADPQMPDVFR